MPDQRIVTVDGKPQIFPADATDAEISAALNAIPASNAAHAPKARTWTDVAVDALPAAGAVLGGVLGSVPGAIIGGAGGEAWKQNINRLRGANAPETASGAANDIGIAGAAAGATQFAAPYLAVGARTVAPYAAKALTATGEAAQQAATSKGMQIASGSGIVGELLQGNLKRALIAAVAPAMLKGTGKALSSAGNALASAAAPAVESAAAATAGSLADDLSLIRASVSKGMNPQTAVRIVASGDKEYGAQLAEEYAASVKTVGTPPLAPVTTPAQAKALKNLLSSPSFKSLAK